jgi:hypothetical protein
MPYVIDVSSAAIALTLRRLANEAKDPKTGQRLTVTKKEDKQLRTVYKEVYDQKREDLVK